MIYRKEYYWLACLVISSYFIFLICRIVLERNPISPLLFTSFLVISYTFLRSIQGILLIKNFYYPSVLEKSTRFSKIRYFVYRLEGFFKKLLLQDYLDSKPLFNALFYYIMLLLNKLELRGLASVIILTQYAPWVIFYFCFVYDILQEKILFSLYALSFNLLIKLVTTFIFFLAGVKKKNVLDYLMNRYFFTWPIELKRYFLKTSDLSEEYLLKQPVFCTKQQKEVYFFLWYLVLEVRSHHVDYSKFTVFNDIFYPKIIRLLNSCNIALFFVTLTYLLLQIYLSTYSLTLFYLLFSIAFFVFVTVIFFRLLFLLPYYFVFLQTFFDWVKEIRNVILQKFSFFSENELLLFSPVKSIQDLQQLQQVEEKNFNNLFSCWAEDGVPLNEEKIQKVFQENLKNTLSISDPLFNLPVVYQELFRKLFDASISWFEKEVSEKRIDLETYTNIKVDEPSNKAFCFLLCLDPIAKIVFDSFMFLFGP